MALIDLTDYDILDLLPLGGFSEEAIGDHIYKFTTAFQGFLIECLMEKLSEDEQITLDLMLNDEDTSFEQMQDFFAQKLPDYDRFLAATSATFKKSYFSTIYRKMLEKAKTGNDTVVPLWERAIASAETDNWDDVHAAIKEIQADYDKDLGAKKDQPAAAMPQPSL